LIIFLSLYIGTNGLKESWYNGFGGLGCFYETCIRHKGSRHAKPSRKKHGNIRVFYKRGGTLPPPPLPPPIAKYGPISIFFQEKSWKQLTSLVGLFGKRPNYFRLFL
jgi:hypothetical protein